MRLLSMMKFAPVEVIDNGSLLEKILFFMVETKWFSFLIGGLLLYVCYLMIVALRVYIKKNKDVQ